MDGTCFWTVLPLALGGLYVTAPKHWDSMPMEDRRARKAKGAYGTSAEEAVFGASLIRFRPIKMTTMAALAGTLPIAIGHRAGAERVPLGMAVVGGLVVSQCLTLYLTPVISV